MDNVLRFSQTNNPNPKVEYQKLSDSQLSNSGDFSFDESRDRRFAFSRQPSLRRNVAGQPHTPQPLLSRSVSSIDMPLGSYFSESKFSFSNEIDEKLSGFSYVSLIFRGLKSGNKPMRRLFLLISLNIACSATELIIGLFSGRVGLISDAFHLTFGCGLLSFSLFSMAASRQKPDNVYTYGYKRLEVFAAFTNALFLLFLSFSLAVEALHAFIHDESEHKHYLIISAITNLLVNLVGVWFFRNYARINLVYRNAEDVNYHSVCLHVLADSIRSAGLILASWLLSLGLVESLEKTWFDFPEMQGQLYFLFFISCCRVNNAEVLCLGLVSATVFMLVMPLFKATGGVLLQMAPQSIHSSTLSKCWRQVSSHEDVAEVSQARFWELVPGHVVGSISLLIKKGMDDLPILQHVHELYHDVGVQELTIQTDYT